MAIIRFLHSFGLFEKYGQMVADPDDPEYIPWLGPLPDEMSMDTIKKQVSLGQLKPDERMAARVAVEKLRGEGSTLSGSSPSTRLCQDVNWRTRNSDS